MTEKQLKTNLLNIDVWIRLGFMLVTLICLFIARVLILFVALFQFLSVLIFGKDNTHLRNFGQGLSKWAFQGLLFLTFNSESKPFPFSDWPEIEVTEPYSTPEREAPAVEEAPAVAEALAAEEEPAAEEAPAADKESTAETDEDTYGGESEVELMDDDLAERDVPSFTEEGSSDEPKEGDKPSE